MTIKELEKRSGLPRTAICFMNSRDSITPERRESNYRDYSEEDARTLEKVKLLRQLSFGPGRPSEWALKEGSLWPRPCARREPILLCTWGYTPGKWLLGLRVRRLDGRKLAWDQAVERLFLVLWRGQGLCIPLYRGVAQLDVLCGLHRRETTALGEGENRCMAPAHSPGPLGGLGGLLAAMTALSGVSLLEPGAAPSRRAVDPLSR